MYRAYRIASTMEIFHTDIEKLELWLGLNGFPKCLLKYVTSKVLTRYHLGIGNEISEVPGVYRKEIILALLYLGPPSIILRRHLNKLVHKFYPAVQFKIMFRRRFRISSLFNHKDRFPMACRSMVVYYICCKKCGRVRPISARLLTVCTKDFMLRELETSTPTTWTVRCLNTPLNQTIQNAVFSFGKLRY